MIRYSRAASAMWLAVGLGVASMTTPTGCNLDTSRESVDTGTFGNTVVTLVCKRIAYLTDLEDGDDRVDVRGDTHREFCRGAAPAPDGTADALLALDATRGPLVTAIDAAFPEDFLAPLQDYLTSEAFLAVYDDGEASAAIDGLIGILTQMRDDPDVAAALERLGYRDGYTPVSAGLGAVHTIIHYPGLNDFLLAGTADLVAGGPAHDELQTLLAALSVTLRNAEPSADPADPDRVGTLGMDLLLSERALLGANTPIPAVRRDHRGVARVTPEATLALPFIDADGDGFFDVDDLGRFIDDTGAPVAAPAPFSLPDGEDPAPWPFRDALGRALAFDGGPPIYEYTDLDRTLLAALLRDAGPLFEPDTGTNTGLDLVRGASALMGPRTPASRTYADGTELAYSGFNLAQSPLLDILHGYLQVLDTDAIYDALALARTLMTDHEAELARLAEALIGAARMGDAYPDVALVPGSPVFDDLIPVLQAILTKPGLAEDVMAAMERPEVGDLDDSLASFLRFSDRFSYDPITQEVVGSLSTEVDRDAPNTGFNRSIMQRVLHMVADASGNALCNKTTVLEMTINGVDFTFPYAQCELLQIDDLAVFYVQSMAYAKDAAGNVIIGGNGLPLPKAEFPFRWGDAEPLITDGALELLIGIDGFRSHPTPEALNRTLFLEPRPSLLADIVDPPRCNDGELYTEHHADTLPAWELGGFYDQIRPIVQAFADHDAEDLFVDLLVVMHNHWPARDSADHQQIDPAAPGYAFASDIAGYEPLIADILANGDLLDAVVATAPTLGALTVNGKPYERVLMDVVRHFVRPSPGLAHRDGTRTSTTADGRPVNVLTPWQLLADAYQRKRARLAETGADGLAWQDSFSELIDVLARGQDDPVAGWRFRNPRLPGVSVAVLQFVEDRLRARDQSPGERSQWLRGELPDDIEDLLAGPIVPAAGDLVAAIADNPDAVRELNALIAYLADEQAQGDSFRAALSAIGDVVQLAVDDADMLPLARVVGAATDPANGWVDAQLSFFHAARAADDNATLVALLRHAFTEVRPTHTAVGDIIDAISEVDRVRPFGDLGARYTADDYRQAMDAVAHFLDDERRGLRKFIAIIRGRTP